jgi:hypothetical protein
MPPISAAAGHRPEFDASLLHSSVLHSSTFTGLEGFVLINTVMFLALAIIKLMPKLYINDWITSHNRRTETRGIHPDPPHPGQPATAAHAVNPAAASSTPSPTPARAIAVPARRSQNALVEQSPAPPAATLAASSGTAGPRRSKLLAAPAPRPRRATNVSGPRR